MNNSLQTCSLMMPSREGSQFTAFFLQTSQLCLDHLPNEIQNALNIHNLIDYIELKSHYYRSSEAIQFTQSVSNKTLRRRLLSRLKAFLSRTRMLRYRIYQFDLIRFFTLYYVMHINLHFFSAFVLLIIAEKLRI